MKKQKIVCLLAALALAWALAPGAYAAGPAAASEAYVVMDADTGQVLLASNMDVPKNPASITKIMTMGLACEKAAGDWTVPLTVSHEDVYSLYGTGSSHIALMEGENVALADMLYAAELVSANDAANVLAAYVGGGTIAGGVEAMNAKAAELGLQNTHFANPHGITDEAHYASAYDMAVILRWALAQPGFEQLFCAGEMYTMPATNLQPEQRFFSMQDYIRLPAKSAYVSTVIGSKTGYTDLARYTYACLAEQDGVRLICVVMHSQLRTEKFADVKLLLEYAFANFHREQFPAGQQTAQVEAAGGGDTLGTLELTSPAVSLLLYNGLTADNVQLALDVPERWLLGGDCQAAAVYTIDGAGYQESCTVRIPLQPQGLEALFAENEGKALPAAGAPETGLPAWGVPVILLAVLAAALAALQRAGKLAAAIDALKKKLPPLRRG